MPTQALAFLAVFVYATHATQAIAFEWKPGVTTCVFLFNMTQGSDDSYIVKLNYGGALGRGELTPETFNDIIPYRGLIPSRFHEMRRAANIKVGRYIYLFSHLFTRMFISLCRR